jgi:hypothetical protein
LILGIAENDLSQVDELTGNVIATQTSLNKFGKTCCVRRSLKYLYSVFSFKIFLNAVISDFKSSVFIFKTS